MEGWIRLHRQLMEHFIFKNDKLLKVFIYCLMKASHKKHTVMMGRQKVALEPGQFVFGRKVAASELSMKERTLYDYMLLLKSDNTIDIKSNNKYSIISIVNWALYNPTKEKSNNKTAAKPTTDAQQMHTYNNGNNDNKKYYKAIFEEVRKIYPGTKKGLDTEFNNFKNRHKDLSLIPALKSAIVDQINWRKSKKAAGEFIPEWKHFQTWINQRDWEMEIPQINNISEQKNGVLNESFY